VRPLTSPNRHRGHQGTPGGDFSELTAAVQAYYSLIGVTKIEVQAVADIFNAFMNEVVTKERPFYYHTSDEKLQKIFHHLQEEGIKPKPIVLPNL